MGLFPPILALLMTARNPYLPQIRSYRCRWQPKRSIPICRLILTLNEVGDDAPALVPESSCSLSEQASGTGRAMEPNLSDAKRNDAKRFLACTKLAAQG